MKKIAITIINTGVANIASVEAAFLRAGVDVSYALTAKDVLNAKALILPGVGTFNAGMNSLADQGLTSALIERFTTDRPTLAICLGMQLLCSNSEESPNSHGLGIIQGTIKKFSPPLRTPHFAWSKVFRSHESEGEYAYFAHSYRLSTPPEGWTPYWSEYGERFISMISKGSIVATQFHPELSGEYGKSILSSWIKEASC